MMVMTISIQFIHGHEFVAILGSALLDPSAFRTMAMESSDLEQLLDAPAPSPRRWSGAWLLGLGVSLAVVAVLSVKQGRLGKLGDFAQTRRTRSGQWSFTVYPNVFICIRYLALIELVVFSRTKHALKG